MRRWPLPLLCALGLLMSACSDSTGPRVFSIAGTWRSQSFPDATVEMTLVETARAINGAGHWSTPTSATAFRATGANVGQSASLLFDFDGFQDINFQGTFEERNDTTFLIGALFGSGYQGQPITFLRVSDD